jgi:hypothetical protein
MTTLLVNYATEPPVRLSATDFRNYCVLVWVLVVGFYVKGFESERRFLFGPAFVSANSYSLNWLSASGQA